MKEKHFKTIFPAVAVPLNNDYTINEPEFRAYLRWIKTFYNNSGSPTQLIFLANLATSIGTPTAGFFVTLLMWRKDINAGMRAPRLLQVSMTVCYIFATAITIFALANKLLK